MLQPNALHIVFVIYFKIAQTCILYCKQLGRKSNYLLVKRLKVETTKIICSVTDRELFVLCEEDLACDWLQHNKPSRYIFGVHAFTSTDVKWLNWEKEQT